MRFLSTLRLRPLLGLGLTLTLAVTAACSVAGVSGEGDPIRQARPVSGFTSIHLEFPGRLEVRPGAAFSVEVEAQPNLQSLITTRVEGSTLVITNRETIRNGRESRFFVTMPDLAGLDINGSGDARILAGFSPKVLDLNINGSGDITGGVAAGELRAHINGSGTITLKGSADALTARISGSGDVKGLELTAKSAQVAIEGSGDVSTQVSEALDIRIAGSGSVRYKGTPTKVTQQVDGSGSIVKM